MRPRTRIQPQRVRSRAREPRDIVRPLPPLEPAAATDLPAVKIHLSRLYQNARALVEQCGASDIEVMGVTKVTCAHPAVTSTLVEAGVPKLGDSRLGNLRTLKSADIRVPLYLLRVPSPSSAAQTVQLADGSLNSDLTTLQCLDRAARDLGLRHRIILMVDLGDLREGIWPDAILSAAAQVAAMRGLILEGLGVSLTCLSAVVPTREHLEQLVALAHSVERHLGMRLATVSGGSSSSLPLALSGQAPCGITQLRLGESIMLGRETATGTLVPGTASDVFILEAEVVEVARKPSLPVGPRGLDAFGREPRFIDRGWRLRALCAIGRQDMDPDGLRPVMPGVGVLGATGDYLVLDVEEAPEQLRAGDVLRFKPNYGCLLAAMTSPYVSKVVVP